MSKSTKNADNSKNNGFRVGDNVEHFGNKDLYISRIEDGNFDLEERIQRHVYPYVGGLGVDKLVRAGDKILLNWEMA